MKKWFMVLMLLGIVTFTGCYRGPVLNLLNWGEYINEDLLLAFEEQYGVRVVLETADSNEIMYTKIKAQTTKFDVAIPSDYMMHKLQKEGLLHELDFDLLPNYNVEDFDANLEALRDAYFPNNRNYGVPYFWGSLGIMYNNTKPGVEEMVLQYEWEVFFNKTATGTTKIGMYDSIRDAVAVGLLHLGLDVNTRLEADFEAVETLLGAQDYFTWGTDNLKEMVANGNCDIALVYSGDFFDMLYATMEDEGEITYDMHVPVVNNVWFDAMVIPTTTTNSVMAHNFINFMLDFDNAYDNASEIGYCPTLATVYEALLEDEDYADIIDTYPYYPGIVTDGTVYEDLGQDIYRRLEILLSNVKTG